MGCEVKLFDLRKTLAPVAELKGHTHDVTGMWVLFPTVFFSTILIRITLSFIVSFSYFSNGVSGDSLLIILL